jgi:hypothetical protein
MSMRVTKLPSKVVAGQQQSAALGGALADAVANAAAGVRLLYGGAEGEVKKPTKLT